MPKQITPIEIIRNPWFSPEEIKDLCAPLKQKAAQCAYLQSLGLIVKRKPDGSPLVLRSNAESVLGSVANLAVKNASFRCKAAPNKSGLVSLFNKKD